MNIHEYQAKELLSKFGIKIPRGHLAESASQAVAVARELGGNRWVVKAQVHAGGRGKAGGIKLASSLDEVQKNTTEILGKRLVTKQTGAAGKTVRKVLVEEALDIEHEYYVGVILDRGSGKVTFIVSAEGGVDIETVAKNSPDKIITAAVDPAVGFSPYIGRHLSYGLGLRDGRVKQAVALFQSLYNLYTGCDCTLAEINPLVTTAGGDVVALDAKLNFDDNALFRQPAIAAYRDLGEESPEETEAANHGLTYIGLDGNIGCLVNGAGLAMATMDIIKLYGGQPANFLDAGGSATTEAIETAFTIILGAEQVSAVLINIFGGILRCDTIANGVVAAARNLAVKVPVVVRLEGTNVEVGKKILGDSGLAIITADNLADGAEKVVAAANRHVGNKI